MSKSVSFLFTAMLAALGAGPAFAQGNIGQSLYQRREFLTRGGFPFCYGCDSRLAKEIRHVSTRTIRSFGKVCMMGPAQVRSRRARLHPQYDRSVVSKSARSTTLGLRVSHRRVHNDPSHLQRRRQYLVWTLVIRVCGTRERVVAVDNLRFLPKSDRVPSSLVSPGFPTSCAGV